MTPGARLQTAAELLEAIIGGAPAERVLTRWARASRFAGSKDRAAVRDVVFDVLRRRRSALWVSGAGVETGRALVTGLLAMQDPAQLELFDGGRYAPAPLSQDELAALRQDIDAAPRPMRLDFPDFLEAELDRSLGAGVEAAMLALRHRAPVDLRHNPLRGSRDAAIATLAQAGIATEPVAGVPGALRVTLGERSINGSRAYRTGLVDLQDAASQLVASALGAKPGEQVLDMCAGGGGKTLGIG